MKAVGRLRRRGRAPREGDQDADRRRRWTVQEELDRVHRGRREGDRPTATCASAATSTARARGQDGRARHRLGARPIPGVEFGGRVIGTEGAWADEGAAGEDRRRRRRRLGRRDRLGLRPAGHRGRCCFEALERVLPTEDADISKAGRARLQEAGHRGPHGHFGRGRRGGREGREVHLRRATAARSTTSSSPPAAGPTSRGSGLDEAGVALDEQGLVEVDGALRTSSEGVYAIGDLVARPGARPQGLRRGHHRRRGRRRAADPPDRVHRHPARDLLHAQRRLVRADRGAGQGGRPRRRRSARSSTAPSAAGTVYGDRTGLVKIVGDKRYGELLGGHIVGSQGDRADPGARQRQRARGRLPRGRAHHPRPPDPVRGGHGSRPRRRRLADPRLRPRSLSSIVRPFYFDLGAPESYLAAERVTEALRRGARVRAGAGVAAARRRSSGRSAARRSARSTPREIERARPPRRACSRCAGPTVAVRHEPRCSRPTYARRSASAVAFSLAAFRQASRPGASLEDADSVLIAAAACEMHPRGRAQGAGEQGRRRTRSRRAPRTPSAPGVTSVPAVPSATSVRHGDAALAGGDRMRAGRAFAVDRHVRGGVAPAVLADPTESTTSRSWRSTAARSCCCGTSMPGDAERVVRRCARTWSSSRPTSSSPPGAPRTPS